MSIKWKGIQVCPQSRWLSPTFGELDGVPAPAEGARCRCSASGTAAGGRSSGREMRGRLPPAADVRRGVRQRQVRQEGDQETAPFFFWQILCLY